MGCHSQPMSFLLGDHAAFPIEYSKGRAPKTEREIAISTLNAEDMEKTFGETIVLVIDGEEKQLTICGIYSDVTNGASTFHFEVNPWFAYLFSPIFIIACVCLATLFGTSDIRALKISEHIKE